MHYIKLGLWIFILSVLYAQGVFGIFGVYPELLFLFSLIYSLWGKTFRERITVVIVSGIIMGAFSRYGFLFSVLLVLYSSLIFRGIFSGKLRKYMILAVFLVTVLYEGIAGFIFEGFLYIPFKEGLINCIFALLLYPLIKFSFEEKERYIF